MPVIIIIIITFIIIIIIIIISLFLFLYNYWGRFRCKWAVIDCLYVYVCLDMCISKANIKGYPYFKMKAYIFKSQIELTF